MYRLVLKMSYASKLKENKQTKINELEKEFKMIIFALKNLENIIIINITKDPYVILFSYNDVKINLNYNLITKISRLEISNTIININNITFEILKEKGIMFQINSLLELKIKAVQNNIEQIKNIIPNNVIIRNVKDTNLEMRYKDQNNFIVSLNKESLNWDIEYYMHSFISKNITTNELVDKGIIHYFDNLINSYYAYEY